MIRVMSYNTLFGGFDGADDRRFALQAELIREADPDIVLIQEWKGFLDDGGARRFAAERRLGRRALVAAAPTTGQNTAILLKPEIEILSFEADAGHFHHVAAIARLGVPGHEAPWTVASVHLCPNGPDVRLREVAYLAALADGRAPVLIGGDFNTIGSTDPEPDLGALPARFRFRYANENHKADRRPIAAMERGGFVDIGRAQDPDLEPTVPGAAFQGTEFVPFRCDYLFATPVLADRARDYRAIRTDAAGEASDHYPILCAFD